MPSETLTDLSGKAVDSKLGHYQVFYGAGIVETVALQFGEGRQLMRMTAIVHNVPDGPFSHEKRVGQKLAMTAPGNGFGAR